MDVMLRYCCPSLANLGHQPPEGADVVAVFGGGDTVVVCRFDLFIQLADVGGSGRCEPFLHGLGEAVEGGVIGQCCVDAAGGDRRRLVEGGVGDGAAVAAGHVAVGVVAVGLGQPAVDAGNVPHVDGAVAVAVAGAPRAAEDPGDEGGGVRGGVGRAAGVVVHPLHGVGAGGGIGVAAHPALVGEVADSVIVVLLRRRRR